MSLTTNKTKPSVIFALDGTPYECEEWEFKECPICGELEHLVIAEAPGWARLYCPGCRIEMERESREALAEAWNDRPDDEWEMFMRTFMVKRGLFKEAYDKYMRGEQP